MHCEFIRIKMLSKPTSQQLAQRKGTKNSNSSILMFTLSFILFLLAMKHGVILIIKYA